MSKRRFCKTVSPQFVPLVEAGTKTQTIRPTPKRAQDMPAKGDRLTLKRWTGKPYRSKQALVLETTIRGVMPATISEAGVALQDVPISETLLDAFAGKDGFKDWPTMRQWFRDTHGLPFSGILIDWAPLKPFVAGQSLVFGPDGKAKAATFKEWVHPDGGAVGYALRPSGGEVFA